MIELSTEYIRKFWFDPAFQVSNSTRLLAVPKHINFLLTKLETYQRIERGDELEENVTKLELRLVKKRYQEALDMIEDLANKLRTQHKLATSDSIPKLIKEAGKITGRVYDED